jgi:hypothetical protein
LIAWRGRQPFQQSGVQILGICDCRKPVLGRERRYRRPGKPTQDPVNLAGPEAVIGQQQLRGAQFEIRHPLSERLAWAASFSW